jgi:hypothetical protein
MVPKKAVRSEASKGSEAEFLEGVRFTGSFHVGDSPVHSALESLARRLDALHIPYAIVGAMALNEYGFRRATVDIDVLLTAEGLARFKEAWLGRGYVERVPGGRGVRDTEHHVPIDFLIAGEYPGDGKPKEVRFPDPAVAGVRGPRVALLPLERFLELKLASGLSAPHRLRDLADVLDVIRVLRLDESVADLLAPSVRSKYLELWRDARTGESDPAP